MALIQIASNLHALTLPIMPAGTTADSVASVVAAPIGTKGPETAPSGSVQVATSNGGAINVTNGGNFNWPPACLLSIVLGSSPNSSAPSGVVCQGFVKRVSAILKGPWLQGDFNEQTSYANLPSFLDCEFTFVSQPGYTNNFTGASSNTNTRSVTTTALDVYRRFYNDTAPNVSGQSLDKITYTNINGSSN